MKQLFLFFILALFIPAHGVTIEKNGRFFKAVNIHSFSDTTDARNAATLLAAADRDLVLIPVKNPSNPVFSIKNPSFLQQNRKIKLTIDGKLLYGKILSLNQGFFEINVPFDRGHSETAVFDMEKNCIAGLLSHFTTYKNGRRFFAVRLDNLNNTAFEWISAHELLDDLNFFNEVKKEEAHAVYALFSKHNEKDLQAALRKNMSAKKSPRKWKSTYLKNETEKSQNNIKQIYRRFLNEKIAGKK